MISRLLSSSWVNQDGNTGIQCDNVIAIDVAPYTTSISTSYMHILEDLPATDTAVVEQWRTPSVLYGDSWGEDTLYEGLDITTDQVGNIFILELDEDGDPQIWAIDSHYELIGKSGKIGIDDLATDPARMDCYNYSAVDEMHVLTDDDTVTRFIME